MEASSCRLEHLMSSMELWVKSVSLPISWSRFRGLGGGGVEREEESARVKRRERGQRSLEEEKKENESGINNI